MIVSDDYVLGAPASYSDDNHVVSLHRNGGTLIPGNAARTLCGLVRRTYNFAGACLPWHYSAMVCAKCRAVALGPKQEDPRP